MDAEIITAGNQQYAVAGWPQRLVARGLDVALVILACAIPGEAMGLFKVPLGLVYLLMGNGLMKGASLGKRAMGLKVIDARYGGPCRVTQDLVRQYYLISFNPICWVLMAYDAAQGGLTNPETYVVQSRPTTAAETQQPPEKPAKLDLAGMGETLKKMREARDEAGKREG